MPTYSLFETSCSSNKAKSQPVEPLDFHKENCNTLMALVWAAQQLNVKGDTDQLLHQLGYQNDKISNMDLCRSAMRLGLKAQIITPNFSHLLNMPKPALIQTKKGWWVLESIKEQSSGSKKERLCTLVETMYDGQQVQQHNITLRELEAIWCGVALLLAEQEVEISNKSFGFGWFFPSIKKHFHQFKWILLVSLMMQLIALVSPMIFSNVIDRVLVSRNVSSLQVLGFALMTLAVFEPIYGYVRSWLFANVASKINSELSARLYQHLTALPLTYFERRKTGEIIARIREMAHIREFLTGSALMLVLDLVFIVLFIAVMFAYAESLTWICIASLAFYFFYWLAIGPVFRARVLHEYELNADNTAFLSSSITGIETIKTTATEIRFGHRWQRGLAAQIRASFKAKCIGLVAGQGISLIQKVTAALILWCGVNLVIDNSLTVGELVAFNMLSGHVTQPILRLAQVWQDFQHTMISLLRVGDILDEPQEQSSGGLASIPDIEGGVSFHNVRFRYEKDSPEILQNLSLNVEPGEFIGMTGASGSGKSTITKLLQGMYAPQHGEVTVGGLDITISDPVELRRNMSIVLQESMLFFGTIDENIRLCCPWASKEQVIRCASLAGAHSFITQLPNGYDTQVGERGSLLSGGERQRIALARALLNNPKILILDEATSALDYESESAIMENLDEICRGRTVISIAHRLNTLRNADRILVLDKGCIVEQGAHFDLVGQDGLYAKLWALQS
ncbi:type I secretion system permease/ATPase [Vibrio splendidus]